VVLATQELDDGWDSEAQSVAYEPDIDRIVTMTDHGGDAWNSYVQQFDTSLNPVGASIDASTCAGFPNDGAFGAMITLPGLSGLGPSAFTVFEFRESYPPDIHHLFGQRVDLTNGALAWPSGVDACAGKKVVTSPGDGSRFLSGIDWDPAHQNVAVAYTVNPGQWGPVTDAYFTVVDPKSGAPLAPVTHLNAGGPGKAFTEMPKVAWDGEEFLTLWMDGRDPPVYAQIRMAKFDASGNVLGGGDALLQLPGWSNGIPTWTGRALVGHGRIHAFVSNHRDTDMSQNEVWMCIEPAYP
jgi:hypothetical protein